MNEIIEWLRKLFYYPTPTEWLLRVIEGGTFKIK